MKREYKALLRLWLAEFVVVFFLDKAGVQIQSLLINAICALLFLLPIVILLVLMSKDESFSAKKQMLFKMLYVFIIFCYVLGLAAKAFLG